MNEAEQAYRLGQIAAFVEEGVEKLHHMHARTDQEKVTLIGVADATRDIETAQRLIKDWAKEIMKG